VAAIALKLPRKDLLQHLTLCVRITGFRGWRLRKWTAVALIKLSAAVIGCKSEISIRG
jgi:hypothetical protein